MTSPPSGPNDAADRPVFIVGCPRSGTTLLQRLLDAHPDVAIAPETFFMRRFWARRAEYGDLQRDAPFERLLHDLTATAAFAEMGLDADAFVAAAHRGDRSYPAIFRLLLMQFAAQRGAHVVGEKTPNHVLHLPALRNFFPAARFIHLVRDPRAVAYSWRSVPWSSGRLWRDAEVWVEYVAAGRAAGSDRDDALLAVHFERLVRAPEATLRRICAHLALEYDPALLAFHERAPETVNVEREPWKANATRPIDPSAADRWRAALTPQQVATVEAVAGDEMRHWGYGPEQPAWRRAALRATLPLRRLGWKLDLVFGTAKEAA